MAIERVRRSSNFTIINNTGLKNSGLSFKARGLLAYMLSLPDDWVFYETELVKRTPEGRDSIRSGLKELEDAGHLIRKVGRNDRGRFKSVDWYLYEEPQPIETPKTENPTSGKPITDKPTSGNPPLLSTKSTKDLSLPITNLTKDIVGQPDHAPYKDVIDYLNQKTGKQFRKNTSSTQKVIKARFKEGFKLEDFKKVIDNKTDDWLKDKKMSEYLRPQTLFGADKFDGYLNQDSKAKKVPAADRYDLKQLSERSEPDERHAADFGADDETYPDDFPF